MMNKICQSCGMPLYKPDMYGTDKDGSLIEDYCMYCFQNGCFTQDVTMNEMIQLCANFVNANSREEAISNMKKQFPTLKRWAVKENTQHEYHKSINKVLNFIHENLKEKIDLKTLAQIANLSPFHFQRIFKATIGESLAEYVKRLRLERVAESLKSSDYSLSYLAEQVGYSSEQALSRAFKKHYNLPPHIFRVSFFCNSVKDILNPRVHIIKDKLVVRLRNLKKDQNDWHRLYTYAIMKGLFNESSETLEIIDNEIYYPAVSTTRLAQEDAFIEPMKIESGLYAIFTHKGAIEKIPQLHLRGLNEWLPTSKYEMRNAVSFVIYLNSLSEVSEDNLLAEIYIPIQEL